MAGRPKSRGKKKSKAKAKRQSYAGLTRKQLIARLRAVTAGKKPATKKRRKSRGLTFAQKKKYGLVSEIPQGYLDAAEKKRAWNQYASYFNSQGDKGGKRGKKGKKQRKLSRYAKFVKVFARTFRGSGSMMKAAGRKWRSMTERQKAKFGPPPKGYKPARKSYAKRPKKSAVKKSAAKKSAAKKRGGKKRSSRRDYGWY